MRVVSFFTVTVSEFFEIICIVRKYFYKTLKSSYSPLNPRQNTSISSSTGIESVIKPVPMEVLYFST
ncbi:hypothetical protein BMETH_172_1 [methanotrophic bacterial endosymbiont of Bathymodiolus sp.]|nr:hypothetical protein BMETH_172_1 [methanotrophic bacterial endosymbiont of Bathymodiolus sp.]